MKYPIVLLLLIGVLFLSLVDALSSVRVHQPYGGGGVTSPVLNPVTPSSSSRASPSGRAIHPSSGERSSRLEKVIVLRETSTEGTEGADPVVERVAVWKRIANYFRASKDGEELPLKERLKKMGLATVLSYGWVSNVNSVVLTSLAYYAFTAKTKVSPLAPGQWKPFLAVYASLYLVSNFLRPFRVAVAIAIGPFFENSVVWIEKRTGMSRGLATTTAVLAYNLVGTTVLMISGVSLASLLSGVPLWATKSVV